MYCDGCQQEKGRLLAPYPLAHTCGKYLSVSLSNAVLQEPLNKQPPNHNQMPYEIKPLKWEQEISGDTDRILVAETPFGHYSIALGSGYYWYFGLNNIFNADSEAAAKAAAENHWQERVKQCLVEIDGSRTNYGQDEPLGSQHLDHEKRFFNPK